MPDNDKIIEDAMAPLRARYLVELAQAKRKLERFYGNGSPAELSDEDVEEIRLLVHRSMGTGNIFGFPLITRHGCTIARWLTEAPRPEDKVILTEIQKFLTACTTAIDEK